MIIKNRKIAIIITVFIVLAGIWIGAFRSLNGLHQRADKLFNLGVDGDGFSINNDLTNLANQAYNLAVLTDRNGLDKKLTDTLRATADDLLNAEGPKAKFEAYTKLNVICEEAYDVLAKTVTGQDLKLAGNVKKDINSVNDIISRDGYNNHVAKMNKDMNAFPGFVLRLATGTKNIELFK